MLKLELNQWPCVADLLSEDIPFVTISMLYQRKMDGTIWVDNLSHPSTVIASFAKDGYAVGDLKSPPAQAVLYEIYGSMPDTPGLRQALQMAWGSFTVIPLILHTHQKTTPSPALPEGFRSEERRVG